MRKIAIVLPFLACAAAAAPVGILVSKSSEMFAAPVAGFKAALGAEAAEGNMEGDAAKAKSLCQKFQADNCKVVFAVGKDAAEAALKALPGTPVVYAMIMNPEEDGIKGANVTGVTLDVPMNRQFESFKSVIPSLKKVGLVYSGDTSDKLAREMKAAAGKTGLSLVEKKVAGEPEVPAAIRQLKGQIDGLYLPPDRTIVNRDAFQFIALFTFENNLPFMAPTSRFVQKGALVALMIDYEDVGKQAAEMVKKILGGKAASAVPPEPPRATILVLNQKTAQTIGINLPPALLEKSELVK